MIRVIRSAVVVLPSLQTDRARAMATGAERNHQTSATALQMANTSNGDGVTGTMASYRAPPLAKGIYFNGRSLSGVVPLTTGVILPTGNTADFIQSSRGPNRCGGNSAKTTGGTDTSWQKVLRRKLFSPAGIPPTVLTPSLFWKSCPVSDRLIQQPRLATDLQHVELFVALNAAFCLLLYGFSGRCV